MASRPRRRRWAQRLLSTFSVFVLTAIALSAAGVFYAKRSLDAVERVDLPSLTQVGKSVQSAGLGPTTIENYLIVGSDSRAGANPDDADAGAIGNAQEVTGQRSDTIMILRFDPSTNSSTLLSLPRDLWVPIAGTNGGKNKINSAFSKSSDVLINTIQNDFGIPIHHYVEVGFDGFKSLVDAVGGVTINFPEPARDTATGFEVLTPGCNTLDGTQALAFARSRHYETFTNGKWREDPSADLGRIARQQDFLKQAFAKALATGSSNPLAANQLISAALNNIKIDKGLDIFGLANRLRQLGSGGIKTWTLPASLGTAANQSVLFVDDAKAQPIIDFFKGTGPEPADPAATPGNAVPVGRAAVAAQSAAANQTCS